MCRPMRWRGSARRSPPASGSSPSGTSGWRAYGEADVARVRGVPAAGGRPAAARTGTPSLKTYAVGEEIATRNASQDAIQALAGPVPELFGGAADLSESNLTDVKGEPNFSADEPGRNLRFGVREHAMGGIANGIAYHGGFIPYDATFLTFSDYMRGAVRLSALAGLHVIDVWTHDSVGSRRGRPDPSAGRALRGPAGDPEPVVRAAGRCQRDGRGVGPGRGAAGRSGGAGPHPPEAPRAGRARPRRRARGCAAAGTCCARRAASGDPDLILIGDRARSCSWPSPLRNGSRARGSAPGSCRSPAGRRSISRTRRIETPVLPPSVRKRVSVEIGVSLGWERWVGDEGAIIGLDHFGASAPAGTIFEKFGFTADRVTDVGRAGRPRGPARPDPDRRGRPLRAHGRPPDDD